MWIFDFFRRKERRDRISPKTIRIGSILKVYPASRSHVNKPYLVRVTWSDVDSFTTTLVHPEEHEDPHCFTFVYRNPEWKEYHWGRFQIIKK